MTEVVHHIPERLLIAYASGSLNQAFSLVVASHISLCPECRVSFEAHCAVGGAVLDDGAGAELSAGAKSALMSRLDEPVSDEPPLPGRSGPYPGPVVAAMGGPGPRWRKMGLGVKQCILRDGPEGSVRLLSIPSGQSMPDHGHGGLEMTLVLQGAFRDETGRFGVGDVEVADEDLEHTPVAETGETCICLAASDAPLQFRALIPRILQPVFRI